MAEEYFLDGDDGEQDITHNLLFNSKMLDENEICSNNCTVVDRTGGDGIVRLHFYFQRVLLFDRRVLLTVRRVLHT